MRATCWSRIVPLALAIGCGGGSGTESSTDGNGGGTLNEGPLQYAPIATWNSMTFEGYDVRYYMPPDPIGVIFFFHGSGMDATIVNFPEPVAFLNELILAGIGFVSTESEDRAGGHWDDGDSPRVGRLYELFLDDPELGNGLGKKDPLFTGGFSGGGNMTGLFGGYAKEQGWPITAQAPHNSSCWGCAGYGIPTAWSLTENDTDPLSVATDTRDGLKADGVPTKFWIIPEEPFITPDSFLKHPEMDMERSQEVFDDMIAKGGIDADGVRIIPIEEAESWCGWYSNNGDSFAPSARAEQIRVLWALHRMNAVHTREIRDFFLEHI